MSPHPASQLPYTTLSFRRSCSGTAAVISVRLAKPFSRRGGEGVAPSKVADQAVADAADAIAIASAAQGRLHALRAQDAT